MLVCGIDPGQSGAMCVLDTQNPAHTALLDFQKTTIYEAALWLNQQQVDIVYLEEVHSIYGASAKSNFTFGRNVGVALTVAHVVTKGVSPIEVRAKVWQKFIGVTAKGKAIKKNVADLATALYPSADLYGPKGGLKDGRADAIMIAHYGLNHLP